MNKRLANVQGYSAGIPWEMHLNAWDAYAKKWGRSQTAERMHERGGFSAGELDVLIPGWREDLSIITKLQDELYCTEVELESALVQFPKAPTEFNCVGELATEVVRQYEAKLALLSKSRMSLRIALDSMMEIVGEPPEPNCHCHISAPCNDCVDNAVLREAFTFARAAIKECLSE